MGLILDLSLWIYIGIYVRKLRILIKYEIKSLYNVICKPETYSMMMWFAKNFKGLI